MVYQHNSEYPVYIELDKTLVGYLASITGLSINEVVSTIRDLADKALQRLRKRKSGCLTYCYAAFPNTNVKFKIKCKKTHNSFRARQDRRGWENSFKRQFGLSDRDPFWNHPEWRKWTSENPPPKVDYSCIMVTATVYNDDQVMNLSDDEVSLLAIESIFLGAAIQDEELESGKH